MSLIMVLRNLPAIRSVYNNLPRLMCSAKGIDMEYVKDPTPHFTDPETQNLLQSMTRLELSKVFRKKTVADNSTEYKFMTTEQLEKEFRQAVEQARLRLQMPPVVKIKRDKQRIISKDTALTGFSASKFVITDITYGLRQSDRKVVIRQTDGTLEYAPMALAKRMNQLYFPLNGRKIRTPLMFQPDYLERVLNEHKYAFVLDRLMVQYEPYDEEFHRVSVRVYQHLNETKEFNVLRSTRHFGPMAFFYAWHNCIDDLLYDMIRRDYLRNGTELIALLYKLHDIPVQYAVILQQIDQLQPAPDLAIEALLKATNGSEGSENIKTEIETAIGKTREDFEADTLCLKFIEEYIAQHALKKVQLELAVQTLKEINAEKKQLYDGLSKAHGVQ